MTGRKFGAWKVGDTIAHALRHTVTAAENRDFTLMTRNPQPLHLDADYAAQTEFGQIVVNGLFTFSLMVGVSVEETTLGTLVANLGYDEVRSRTPVFIGDVLRFETEIAELRESQSRPQAGIVTFKHRAFNQRDELVCETFAHRTGDEMRSLLFVPGDRPDRFAKAAASGADALILDLEDSVTPANKAAAREAAADYLQQPRTLSVVVRINPATIDDDLEAVLPHKPDAIMLPKAEGAQSVLELAARTSGIKVLPIATETPRAVFQLGSYADVASHLFGLSWGAEDLPAAIGAAASRETDGRFTAPYELLRSLTLFAAHAANAAAIETVYPDFKDEVGLAAYAARARRDGFTGMLAIHPAQVAVIHAAFTPTQAELAWAGAVVAAFAANPGTGALQLEGRMIDAPHLKAAQKLLKSRP